jgi:two-component sensor histidine kinase
MPQMAIAPTRSELTLRLRQQELVAEFGVFAMRASNLQQVLDEASVIAAQGLETRFAKVLEWLPGEMAFLVRSGVGWREGVVGEARVGGDLQSPAGYAFRSGKPVISNHLASEQRFRTPKLLEAHGIKSAINVLVTSGSGTPFGVLEGDSTGRHEFGEPDLAFLSSLANTLAVAVETQQRQDLRDQFLAEKDQLLREKDILMKEVHHRVTNSLQLVQTLLNLQARAAGSEEVREQLEQAAGRILTIGTVHKRLYQGSSVSSGDAAIYLRGLLDDMQDILADRNGGRETVLDIEPMQLSADQLTPLGLITGELVTNALKHGEGRISIRVSRGEGGIEVAVSDEGPGFPDTFNPVRCRGLGMRLITALAKGGSDSVQIDRSVPHSRIVVRIPADAA